MKLTATEAETLLHSTRSQGRFAVDGVLQPTPDATWQVIDWIAAQAWEHGILDDPLLAAFGLACLEAGVLIAERALGHELFVDADSTP